MKTCPECGSGEIEATVMGTGFICITCGFIDMDPSKSISKFLAEVEQEDNLNECVNVMLEMIVKRKVA